MIRITESNVTIMVRDINRSIKFYESIGLTLKQRWDDHYAMISTEGVTLGLHPSDSDQCSSGSVSIGFMIDKVEDAKALLEQNGIQYKYDDGKSGKYVHFTDPDNTILYFVEPKWR